MPWLLGRKNSKKVFECFGKTVLNFAYLILNWNGRMPWNSWRGLCISSSMKSCSIIKSYTFSIENRTNIAILQVGKFLVRSSTKLVIRSLSLATIITQADTVKLRLSVESVMIAVLCTSPIEWSWSVTASGLPHFPVTYLYEFQPSYFRSSDVTSMNSNNLNQVHWHQLLLCLPIASPNMSRHSQPTGRLSDRERTTTSYHCCHVKGSKTLKSIIDLTAEDDGELNFFYKIRFPKVELPVVSPRLLHQSDEFAG